MIYSLIQLPAPVYWSFILATLAGIVRCAYLLGSSPRPSPLYRRLLIFLPRLVLAAQVLVTDQGKATVLIVQWR